MAAFLRLDLETLGFQSILPNGEGGPGLNHICVQLVHA